MANIKNSKNNLKTGSNVKGKKKSSLKKKTKNNEQNKSTKVLTVLGVIVLGFIIIYLMKYYFVDKSYIKINMSTDKKLEYINLEGEKELISTQKFVSDLNYSMRYDIDKFKVFKYKNQDIYKFLNNDMVLVVVEKSNLPKSCSLSNMDNGYNNCYVKIDHFTEEYYISTNGKTYKITVKSLDTVDYQEGIKTRINYMINSFIINF